MSTYLSTILEAQRAAASQDHRNVDDLVALALARPTPRPFREALAAGSSGRLGVIAEIKRRSPSKGDLALDLAPATLAQGYQDGGAVALSVLTNVDFFGGSPEDLALARSVVGIPVLRKDFTVGPADVCDARIMGADALLLIVAALSDAELAELLALSRRLELGALVEVHDQAELERALAFGADIVGVNQRDLRTFEVDTQRAQQLAASIPASVIAVAESGIVSAQDAEHLAGIGYDAILVGETLVRSEDQVASVRALSGHRVGARQSASAR
jgi:indole-3-glycerol phosphate synthase